MKTITWLRSLASRLVPAKRPRWRLDELTDLTCDDVDPGWAEVTEMLPDAARDWQPPAGGDAA